MFDELNVQVATEPTATDTPTTLVEAKAQTARLIEEDVLRKLSDPSDQTIPTITSRFEGVMNLRLMSQAHIVIIGAGGIGSPIVKNLAAMGCKNLTVIDPDTVEPQNIGTQFHKVTDIGRPKVQALRDEILERYYIEINPLSQEVMDFQHLQELTNFAPITLLIGAVDNMEIRNTLGHHFVNKARDFMVKGYSSYDQENLLPKYYIDTRMSLGLWNVFTIPVGRSIIFPLSHQAVLAALNRYKEQALFPQEEAMTEPCTARALGYTGENIASYVAALADFMFRVLLKPNQVDWDHRRYSNPHNVFFDNDTQRKEGMPFRWTESFDARNFQPLNTDPFRERLKTNLANTMKELSWLKKVNQARDMATPRIVTREQDPLLCCNGKELFKGSIVAVYQEGTQTTGLLRVKDWVNRVIIQAGVLVDALECEWITTDISNTNQAGHKVYLLEDPDEDELEDSDADELEVCYCPHGAEQDPELLTYLYGVTFEVLSFNCPNVREQEQEQEQPTTQLPINTWKGMTIPTGSKIKTNEGRTQYVDYSPVHNTVGLYLSPLLLEGDRVHHITTQAAFEETIHAVLELKP